MRDVILERLRALSPEEERLLRGESVRREDYTRDGGDFRVDSGQVMPSGEMIFLRPHTRFAAFPRHSHNYVEMMYMVSGETHHLVNDQQEITLRAGEILMMNQRAVHAIDRAGENDVAVNIIVQPAFFREMLTAIGEDNPLGRFLVGCLTDRPEALSCLVFHVADDIPVQCVMESMVATLVMGGAPLRVNQTAMTLLFLHLLSRPEALSGALSGQSDHALVWEALQEIQEHYAAPSLTQLAERRHVTLSYISRLVKRATGRSWTELLQEKRLMKADELLLRTRLTVAEIMNLVGYNNSSYFYRLYEQRFGVSPKARRRGVYDKADEKDRKVRT